MDKSIKSAIGKRLQQLREKSGLTQEAVAEAVGMSTTAVSMIERGQNSPTLENFVKIANAIGASSDSILCDVLDNAYISKTSALSDKLQGLTASDRNEIISVIEIMIASKTK